MFEQDDQIQAHIKGVYLAAKKLNRGDILGHSTIRAILNCHPHEDSWDHVVKQALRRLENEDGIAYWPVVGVGYKLLTNEEQIDFLPRKRMMKGVRQLRRAHHSVAMVSGEDLTPRQQMARLMIAECLESKEIEIRRNIKSHTNQFAEKQANPRRPIPSRQES